MTHTALRKHLKYQFHAGFVHLFCVCIWPRCEFVQHFPDVFCIEVNTCGSTAVTGALWTGCVVVSPPFAL